VGRRTKHVSQLLTTLTHEQRGKYYTICSKVAEKLKELDLGPLNMDHCEFICQSLKDDRKITVGALKKLSSPPPPVLSGEKPGADLFNSSETESSSSSDPASG
jgi:hypothetical protein